MTAEQVFSVVNTIALLSWVGLAVFPRRRWVTAVLTGTVVPLLLAVAYIAALTIGFRDATGSFATLAGVASLFANPWLLLAGWIHYLAFDLLIGSWEVRDAQERGVPHLLLIPCLALTFLFGPAGWLLYVVVRAAGSRGTR